MIKKIISIIILYALFVNGISAFAVGDNSTITLLDITEDSLINQNYATGLRELTEEEELDAQYVFPRIVDVRPNRKALERAKSDDELINMLSEDDISVSTVTAGEEIIYEYPRGQTQLVALADESNDDLPSQVDNSKELTFPPIGNQGDISSCVSWAAVYYQFTNNLCNLRKVQAKTENGDPIYENIMSPRFTYTLTNLGGDNSTTVTDIAGIIQAFGCPSLSDYPGELTIDNLDDWCTDTEVWRRALYNRPAVMSYNTIQCTNYDENNQDINNIKKLLWNGDVVSVSTYIYSFEPANVSTGNELAYRYMTNSNKGRHCMTIVGYDDNFGIDVNDNGFIDSYEYGAFKLANSWGENWEGGNAGFVWVAYDALGDNSNMEGDQCTNRRKAFSDYFHIQPAKDYTPVLVAETTIETNMRDQIKVQFGISDVTQNEPTNCVDLIYSYNGDIFRLMPFNVKYPFSNDVYKFSNNNPDATEITIPFDLTPIIQKTFGEFEITNEKDLKFYVIVNDTGDNEHDVKLKNVSFYEPCIDSSDRTDVADNTALSANNSMVMKSVEYRLTPYIFDKTNNNITLTFNCNISEDLTGDICFVSDRATISANYVINNKQVVINTPIKENTSETDSESVNEIEDIKELEENVYYELNIQNSIVSEGGLGLDEETIIPIYVIGPYNYEFYENITN